MNKKPKRKCPREHQIRIPPYVAEFIKVLGHA
jgi:hypothetical protein